MTTKTKKLSIFATSNDDLTPKQRFWIGLFLWVLLILGYFVFILNWILPLSLGGFEYENNGVKQRVAGWEDEFFAQNGRPGVLQTSIANWGVTAARGLASLFTGWFIAKFTHKKASLIALSLLSVSLLGVFATNYWVFLLTRFIMSVGGTTLIVLIQPVISRFFDQKQRSYFSQISPTASPLAGLVSFLLVFPLTFKVFLVTYWRPTIAVLGLLCVSFLILYMIFGKDFNIVDLSDKASETSPNVKPNTYLGIIKEKQTWYWIFLYGIFLLVYLLPLFTIPNILLIWVPQLQTQTNGSWRGIYGSLVMSGSLVGFLGGFYSKTRLPRKLYFVLTITLFWVSLLLLILTGVFPNYGLVLSYIAAFTIGNAWVAMQTVLLNIPHEYVGNTPKRMGIFMSYIWGGGYLLYTLVDALTSGLIDIYKANKVDDSFPLLPLIPVFVVFTSLILFVYLIQESRPWSAYKKQKKLEENKDL